MRIMEYQMEKRPKHEVGTGPVEWFKGLRKPHIISSWYPVVPQNDYITKLGYGGM